MHLSSLQGSIGVTMGTQESPCYNLSRASTMALRNESLWSKKEDTWPPVTHRTSEPGHAFWSSMTECVGI